MFEYILSGFVAVFHPTTFVLMVFGIIMGIIIGAIPGLSGSMGIILLLPLVYMLPSDVALVMLCGLFCGSMYGGSISAVLLNTPGTPSAAATVLDGYPLAQKGKAGKAIGIASFASFIGGLVSTLCLMFIAPELASIALNFQAADYFSLAIFGLTIMASASGGSMTKALIAGAVGLLLSAVGMDPITGNPRFTFGSYKLMSGLDILPILIGVFALSEVMIKVNSKNKGLTFDDKKIEKVVPTFSEMKGVFKVAIVGAIIGVVIGIIPGTGGAIACFLAYNVGKKISKNGSKFGTGELEGVAAPEAANNGTTGGALIPMLALGIPGDVVTSVMLGALVLVGVRPGPMLFVESPDLVYTIFSGMFVIQFLMLGFGFLFARISPKILKIPANILMPIIVVLCMVGAFSIGNQTYHIWVAVIFGVVGYLMKKYGFPGAPLILGVILGPIAEENLNRALIVSNNDISVFFTRPISLAFILLSAFSIGWTIYTRFRKDKQEA